jgi:opacity protein-like surface antigen
MHYKYKILTKVEEKMMVKKILTACLCVVFGTSLSVAETMSTKAFIGLEGGYSEVQGERFQLDNGTYFENTGKDAMFGLRIGAQDEAWRAMFIFDYYDNSDTDQNVKHLLLTVDYFFVGSQYVSTTPLSPYVGANIGYANYESSFVDASGMTYGGQAGLVIGATENVDLDFGYRYSLSKTDEFDHIGSFIFAINYVY